MKKTYIFLFLTFCLSKTYSQQFNYNEVTAHPRLLLTEGGEESVKLSIAENPSLANIHTRILDTCNMILSEAPVTYVKEGKRLLAVSRIALKRIFYLSYAYRMTGKPNYAQRAEEEMLAVSRFSDWNPSHFLDVGEMTMALAIGYDWLHEQLCPETRQIVRNAIVEKGFDAAKNAKDAWFYEAENNWNSVCNGGLLFGALALLDEVPEKSKFIIEKCMETNPKAMNSYGPDGGYPEGFGYWGYGTSFQVLLIAALESAFGTDNGLSQAPGFMQSAKFMQFMTAPGGVSFSFSDTPLDVESNMMMFWFAKKTRQPSLLWLERRYLDNPNTVFAEDRLLPCLLIFSSGIQLNTVSAPSENFWFNRGDTPVYIYRSGWESVNDTYLGIKGGSPLTSHAHMDAGSFVFERDGVRWAMDLGMQKYITLENAGVDLWNKSQNSQRWDVFRLSNIAHNTLTINGERHLADSFAPISATFCEPDRKGAKVDLSTVFAQSVKEAVRTVFLDQDNHLTISDNLFTNGQPANISWIMVTPADAKITGNKSIKLSKNGKEMLLEVTSDFETEMKILSNVPENTFDAENPGTIRVGFNTRIPANCETTLNVKLTPIQ